MMTAMSNQGAMDGHSHREQARQYESIIYIYIIIILLSYMIQSIEASMDQRRSDGSGSCGWTLSIGAGSVR